MATRKKTHPRRQKPPLTCKAPDCGRPAYARGFCQTHHRQMLTLGRVKPIRPYRKRTAGTIKFAGLRLTPECAGKLQQKADEDGASIGAAIATILEETLTRRTPPKED